MDYNTSRPKLPITLYGRHVQRMIEHALTIKDRQERTKAAQTIINVMAQIQPYSRDIIDFRQKLWNHLFVMSDYKLDVDSPYPGTEKSANLPNKPDKISYSDKNITFRFYGRYIQKLIEKASNIKDKQKRNLLVEIIANHMKKTYIHWNRGFINDDIIKEHLKILSNEKLSLPQNAQLNTTKDIIARTRKRRDFHTRSNNNSKRR